MHRFRSCGVRIDASTGRLEVLEAIRSLALDQELGKAVHLCNAFTLASASQDDSYRATLNMSALNLPDGVPVAVVGRIKLRQWKLRTVRGPGLMRDVFRHGESWNAKHFLYGSSPTTLSLLIRKLQVDYPAANIVGSLSPPFRQLESAERMEVSELLKASNADIVWVGLGTPRQDFFIADMSRTLPAVFIGVGAAFDFEAGTVREAPVWLHGSGLEWLFRLAMEPGRLWRRYLVGNVTFLRNCMKNG